jgi:hypothetical protein
MCGGSSVPITLAISWKRVDRKLTRPFFNTSFTCDITCVIFFSVANGPTPSGGAVEVIRAGKSRTWICLEREWDKRRRGEQGDVLVDGMDSL